MSGNPGGGGFVPTPAQDCRSLVTRGTIISPDPTVLAKVKVGTILEIGLKSVTGPIEARTQEGELLGSVFVQDSALIGCLNEDHQFKGEIKELQGGRCVIQISAK